MGGEGVHSFAFAPNPTPQQHHLSLEETTPIPRGSASHPNRGTAGRRRRGGPDGSDALEGCEDAARCNGRALNSGCQRPRSNPSRPKSKGWQNAANHDNAADRADRRADRRVVSNWHASFLVPEQIAIGDR